MLSPQLPKMPSDCRTVLWSFMTAISLLILSGCGGGPALPPLVPVEGKVMVDNDPVTSGQVSFVAVGLEPGKSLPPLTGQIDASGNYKIFTGDKPGAPAGKYKIVVTPSMMPIEGAKGPPKAPFNDKYKDFSKTPLQFEVPKGDGYDLKLTK